MLQEIELAPVAGRSGHLLYPSGRSSSSNSAFTRRNIANIAQTSNREGSGTQNGQVFSIDLEFGDYPLLSSGLAHGAFKKTMRNTPTVGSDQFVEELILTVMV